MGGGRNPQQATTPAPPWASTLEGDPPGAGEPAGGGGGSSDSTSDYCTASHRFRFVLAEGATPGVREPIELVANGRALLVVGTSGPVGQVTGPSAKALEACVRQGFRLRGAVESVGDEFGFGRVQGEPPG